MTEHSNISSVDYINNFTFEYVETYSFQRGTEFGENIKLIRPEYQTLKVRREKLNNLTNVEEYRFLELDNLLGVTQYLINDKGQFHPSSKRINIFSSPNFKIDKIINILQTEIIEVPSWMCSPIYRDAIVFYDKSNNIISTLNVCLSCQYMETKMFAHVNGDNKTYDLLKQFFIDIGHEIER